MPLFVLILFFFVANLFAAAWTGSTSEPENMKKIDGKPFYVITNADELAWFAAQVNDGRTEINAILANDIDAEGAYWTPLGSFDGIIDGDGKEIKNVSLPIVDCQCFINQLTSNGILRNVSFSSNASAYSIVTKNYGLITNVVNYIRISYAGMARENYGKIINCENNGFVSGGGAGGIVRINEGLIEYCRNNGDLARVKYGVGGVVYENGENGVVRFCRNTAMLSNDSTSCSIVRSGMSSGRVCYKYFNRDIAVKNSGKITDCIYTSQLLDENEGVIEKSYGLTSYYLNNTEVQSTAENMQRDQFAWILNTSNGTEENSGVWTRGTDGYPTFANEDSLAIRKVVFDDDGTTSNRYTNYKGQVSFPENPEAPEGLVFSGWYNSDDVKVKPTTVFTADQTVNAIYVDASDVFWTINFYNAAPADTLLESKSYQHGSIVTYGGAAPTLASTAQYTYTFKGWDVEPTNAVEDFDYHAVYDSTVRSYAITFINTDSSKIESATFEYGKMPSCTKTPTRAATAEWTYSHKGWKPALDYVTEAATYMAIYDSSKVEYKVTFMNGTTVIDEQMVPYGDPAVAPTNVTREGYKFVGWNNSFAKVTEALTVKALFEELIIRTVSVVNADGEKIDNVKLEDGETYTLPEAPEKEGYTFDAYYDGRKKLGVAGDEISVTANITITAKYIENRKSSSSQQEIASSSSTSRNDELSSSCSRNDKSSSSSSKAKSSSSEKIEAIVATAIPQFSVQVNGRNIQISTARIGATYALFDMQGKVLLQGRVQTVNFEIPVARSGNYLIRVGNNVQRIAVK